MISQITFSVEKTTPLTTYTHNEDDRYANIRPCASVTITLDVDDRLIVSDAFADARTLCVEELANFHDQMLEAFR